MNETVVDQFTLGVNTFLNSLILVALISIMTIFTKLNSTISEQQAVSDDMNTYMEFCQYDREHVYPQDIVSAVFKYRGAPIVTVSSDAGNFTWAAGDDTLVYNTAAITSKIDVDHVYDAFIEKDANGSLAKIIFIQCDDPNDASCGLR